MEKQLWKFVIFDIKDFYPSIKESLLRQSLDFAEIYIRVSSEDKAIIQYARKCLLFNKQQTLIQKKVDYLIRQWVHMMVLRFVNLLEFYTLSAITQIQQKQHRFIQR